MSYVVYQKNKKTGYVYAYESVSYRDPVTHEPKSKRTFIGRVDPVTKELLDPEKAARLKRKRDLAKLKSTDTVSSNGGNTEPTSEQKLSDDIDTLRRILEEQQEEINKLEKAQAKTQKALSAMAAFIEEALK